MVDGFDRGSPDWLTLQWRNAMALMVAAILLAVLGTFMLVLGGFPSDRWVLLGLLFGVPAGGFAGYSAYLFRLVGRGETRLRSMGKRSPVERSLTGTTVRTVLTSAPADASLRVARDVLSEPKLGLTHVGTGWHGSVRAIRPAETGLVVLDVVPLAVRIRARRSQGRTVLTVSVVPSSVYGWPATKGWFGWSAKYSWIEVARSFADYVAGALVQSLNGSFA